MRCVKNKSLVGALVLNCGYEPIKIVNWQKAIVLWLQDKVDVLEFHFTTVSSPSISLKLPSVLRLKQYVRPYFSLKVRLSRQNVFLRDDFQCQYCGEIFGERKLTIDHIIPLSKGGTHEWCNVVAACSRCNNKKADRTLEQARLKLLKKPVRPTWLPVRNIGLGGTHFPLSWKSYIEI